jgi:hypothetical protein
MAAILEILKNRTIVQIMATHNKTITINPANEDLQPKKAKDQKLLRINCRMNTENARAGKPPSEPLRQIKNNEIPINAYKTIHTGAKTESGGLKNGFLIPTYQVSTDRIVKNDPITPAA